MNYKENFKEIDESTKVGSVLNVERLCDQHHDDTYDFILVKF
jgi:hypothetical protein